MLYKRHITVLIDLIVAGATAVPIPSTGTSLVFTLASKQPVPGATQLQEHANTASFYMNLVPANVRFAGAPRVLIDPGKGTLVMETAELAILKRQSANGGAAGGGTG